MSCLVLYCIIQNDAETEEETQRPYIYDASHCDFGDGEQQCQMAKCFEVELAGEYWLEAGSCNTHEDNMTM